MNRVQSFDHVVSDYSVDVRVRQTSPQDHSALVNPVQSFDHVVSDYPGSADIRVRQISPHDHSALVNPVQSFDHVVSDYSADVRVRQTSLQDRSAMVNPVQSFDHVVSDYPGPLQAELDVLVGEETSASLSSSEVVNTERRFTLRRFSRRTRNESLPPKITTNDTVNLFLEVRSAFC